MIDGISASGLFADKAYDVDSILEKAVNQEMKMVIRPEKKRKVKRDHDEYLQIV